MQKSTNKILIAVLSLTFVVQFLISFKLWIPVNRNYPMIPAFDFFPLKLGVVWSGILFGLSIVGLVLTNFNKHKRWGFLMFIVGMIIFILSDINRLQPWLFINSVLLGILCYSKNNKRMLFQIAFIIGLVYFWSGLQKLNYRFIYEIYPYFMEGIGLRGFSLNFPKIGLLVGILESIIGLGLLFIRTRKIAMWLAIIMHICILHVTGFFGFNESWNEIIWPWNIQIALVLIILTLRGNLETFNIDKVSLRKEWGIVSIFGILPFFYFLGIMDSHMSSSLYSGNNASAIIYTNEEFEPNEIFGAEKYFGVINGQKVILLDYWCLDELKVPAYPEPRYFKKVGKKLCECLNQKEQKTTGIKIDYRRPITSEKRVVDFPCSELLKD